MKLPKLTYKLLDREKNRGNRSQYEIRLLGRFKTLKRMISRREERIDETKSEQAKIEKEILKLKRQIQKKEEYKDELKRQISEIDKELKVYQNHFKNANHINKTPSFYIKIHTDKAGRQYYHGRIRYFMRNGRKRREKTKYFGAVWKLNRKYGENVKKELRKQLEEYYYNDLFGE